MRIAVALAVALAGCSFSRTNGEVSVDAADDAPPVDRPHRCATADGHLRLCFSFDGGTSAMMPNEGAVPVEATLTNVLPIAGQDYGAVKVDTTSEIFIPQTPDVTNIVSVEAWFRVDVDPDDGKRMGVLDTGHTGPDPNTSLFYYREQGIHLLRCEIAKQQIYAPFNAHVGTWAYAACVCTGGTLRIYGNGQLLAETPGSCTFGAIGKDGAVIGQSNDPAGVDDWLVGAIDAVRLWDVPLSATDVCTASGRTDC